MSVNYIDKSTGDLIRVAGQGKAEYGASTERKGDIVVPATTAGNFQSVSVVFAQAMPDNDYAVVVDEGGETWAHGATNVTNKTATGFTLFFVNVAGTDAPQMTFKYRAFKLYTDTEYNNLLQNAILKSDVTDAVTNGDMNPVTSNAVYDALSDGKKIKIATPTLATGVTGIAQYHWQRNECTVLMQGVDVPANFIFNSNFITNLPQAASDAIVQYGVLYVLEWDGSAWQGQRVALTNIPAGDTALKADGNIGGASNTVRVYGSFTYRTKDWYEGE